MLRRVSCILGAAMVTTAFLSSDAVAHGPGGGHGGYAHGGFYHGGYVGGLHPYGPGGFAPYYGRGFYAPYGYGFYRPYYGYGSGFGVVGIGIGLGGYGLGGYGSYLPYYGRGYAVATVPVVVNNVPSAVPPATPGDSTPPPPDNAAHLQLIVPANAEVYFDGEKTTQTGPVREFVSPPLISGKMFTYRVRVRYFDGSGKPVDDQRALNVRANDWFRIDFNQPAPPEQAPPPVP
jgi:uncharacterized protein (TIGR03000 family)